VRSSGTTESKHLTTGEYEIDFNRDLTGCAYTATLGDPAHGSAPLGFIGVASREGVPDGVFLETHNSAAALTNFGSIWRSSASRLSERSLDRAGACSRPVTPP
jgi:hypothetical protein